METIILRSKQGVTLAGGAPFSATVLAGSLKFAPRLAAADAGADRLMALNHLPEAVIGDLDSLSETARDRLADRLHPVTEQITTDFDKALRHIDAPFVIGIGFSGGRMDHSLAALNTLARHPDRACLLLTGRDVVFLAPRTLTLALPRRTRLSLFPMGPVRGTQTGLRWPLQGLDFTPDGRIGTSNEVIAPEVTLGFDAARMLVILPRQHLGAAIDGLLRQRALGG